MIKILERITTTIKDNKMSLEKLREYRKIDLGITAGFKQRGESGAASYKYNGTACVVIRTASCRSRETAARISIDK